MVSLIVLMTMICTMVHYIYSLEEGLRGVLFATNLIGTVAAPSLTLCVPTFHVRQGQLTLK